MYPTEEIQVSPPITAVTVSPRRRQKHKITDHAHRGKKTARLRFTTSDGVRRETRIVVRTNSERIDRVAAMRAELHKLGPDEYFRRKNLRPHPLAADSSKTIADASGVHTFGELADHYRDKYAVEPEVRGEHKFAGMKSWKWARQHVDVLEQALGRDFPLDKLTFEKVRDLKIQRLRTPIKRKGWKKAKARSFANVNRLLGILRRMAKIALRLKWMTDSPFDAETSAHERLISITQEGERRRVLSPNEERTLLKQFEGEAFGRSRAAVIALLDSAVRFGEMETICWHDVDFKKGTITVFAPKTENRREVGLTPRLRATLLKLHRERRPKPDDAVFAGLTYTVLHNDFVAASAASGIKDLRLHDLRHTRATRWIQGGLNESEVAHLLGHSKKTFTTRRYVNPDERTITRSLAADVRFKKEHGRKGSDAVN